MAMIFVPSVNGVSHHHTEHTDQPDLLLGANALINAMIRLATGAASPSHTHFVRAPSPPSSPLSPVPRWLPAPSVPGGHTVLLCIDLQEFPPCAPFTPEQVRGEGELECGGWTWFNS